MSNPMLITFILLFQLNHKNYLSSKLFFKQIEQFFLEQRKRVVCHFIKKNNIKEGRLNPPSTYNPNQKEKTQLINDLRRAT